MVWEPWKIKFYFVFNFFDICSIFFLLRLWIRLNHWVTLSYCSNIIFIFKRFHQWRTCVLFAVKGLMSHLSLDDYIQPSINWFVYCTMLLFWWIFLCIFYKYIIIIINVYIFFVIYISGFLRNFLEYLDHKYIFKGNFLIFLRYLNPNPSYYTSLFPMNYYE